MRLNSEQIQTIREETRIVFGADSSVRLFGSRVDDTARGGDIDLLVECDAPVQERLRKSLALTARLQMRLGDQPIDVLVIDPETPLQAVHQVARQTGVLL